MPNNPDHPDKILLEFIEPAGDRRRVELPPGQSLLEGALDASIKGLTGQCGGAINCATCLVDIDPESLSRLPPQHSDELELLASSTQASSSSSSECCGGSLLRDSGSISTRQVAQLMAPPH